MRFSAPFAPTNGSPQERETFVQRVCLEEQDVYEIKKAIQPVVAKLRASAPNPGVEILLPVHCAGGSATPRRNYRHCANQLLFGVLGPDQWVYPCTTVTATRLERRLVHFTRDGDLRTYWGSEARRLRLWFDVGQECAGFNCSRCEHSVNTHFDLRAPVGSTGCQSDAIASAPGPGPSGRRWLSIPDASPIANAGRPIDRIRADLGISSTGDAS